MSYAPPGWELDCRCPICGTACYPPWLTDDEKWRSVMGGSTQQVCIGCFYERAKDDAPLQIILTVKRERP